MRKNALLGTLALMALLMALAAGAASADRAPDPRFAAPKNYDNPGPGQPQDVARGDFDEDGTRDLVMSVGDAPKYSVLLYKGRRDGTFGKPLRFEAAEEATSIVRADLDGDEHLDLAVADVGRPAGSPGAVVVLLGKGDGTFRPPRSFPSGGEQPAGLAAPDVDGDGKNDLAVANSVPRSPNGMSGNVTILRNKGAGRFEKGQSIEPARPASARVAPIFLAPGDLDGDGDPDLAVTATIAFEDETEDGKVLVLENRRGRYAEGQAVAVGEEPQGIVVDHLNGGGNLDVAAVSPSPKPKSLGAVAVLLGRGDGTLGKAEVFSSAGVGPTSLVARDLNDDGKNDLAVTNSVLGPWGNGNVSVFRGGGDGTFGKVERFRAGKGPVGITAGRFGRDGRVDLAVSNLFSNNLSVLANTTPR